MNKPAHSARWPVFLVAVLLLAPVVYVLSLGPVYWIFARFVSSPDGWLGFNNFYAPVWWLGEQFPKFEVVVAEYAHWGAPAKPLVVE